MELTIEKMLQQGVTAHKEGNLRNAERLYRAILRSQPAHPDANHNLGVLAVSVNKVDEALPLFKTAVDANPKIEQFWLSYIDALIKEEWHENAKLVIEEAKQQGVADEKLCALEAQLTSTDQLNEPKLSVQNNRLSLSRKRKKLSKQQKLKRMATKQKIEDNKPSQQQLGRLSKYYQSGQYTDAEKLASSIIVEFPKHQFAWKVLGAVLTQFGRIPESLVAKEKAVKLAPDDAEAHINFGNALQELERFDEALASYAQAIALKPDSAEAHYNLGITLHELKILDEAEACYKQAVALRPDFAEAHSNLGHTLKKLGRLEDAASSYTQAIALKPDFAEAHSNLGNTLKELGRLREAEARYTQAIALKPDYAEAHYNLGVTLKNLGNFEKAEANYRQAILLKSDLASAHYGLGIILYIKGNEDLALKSIEKANVIEPQSKDYELMRRVMEVRKYRKGNEAAVGDTSKICALSVLTSGPFILNRAVESELIASLYEMDSVNLDKTKRVGLLASGKTDARYGNGKCSPDFNLFEESRPIIRKLAKDLKEVMMKYLKSDVFVYESFFNILGAGGGLVPHTHICDLDKEIELDLGRHKYSLVYYLSVGDQDCIEPGVLKFYEPDENILPNEGMIIIFPASRMHSAVYGGKIDRVMIGVNFYSL